nr:Chain A, EKC/KEOPS complex subunit PCC1 [Saccharomyces cerevisiae S288C]4WXA_B Chain B, EKC/KEOPS complex subunit PCC1 [Saccharomyces cerevisiae S288C]4WXA_C Chain C, EKC/KEOPS complex subunit PCC1 [Saccharomyces cerevisiae S288C]
MTSKREKSLDHTLELKIPFETERQATIATKVLSPDPILKPQDFQVDYSSEKNVMLVQFRSIDDRVLRVGVSSIIDSIKTIVEAMDVLSHHHHHH